MKKFLLFIILFTLFFPLHSRAAEIFFGANAKEIGVGEKIEVGVFINTHNQPINAVTSNISFSKDLFELEGFYDGSSIISFWVERPTLTADGIVNFSGVIPGGVNTTKSYLFSLLLRAKQPGAAVISTTNEEILLDDGLGSAATVVKAPLFLQITTRQSQDFLPMYDVTPPEPFEPNVSRDESVFDGNYFLVFATQDKQSGIDHYEVKEGMFGAFLKTESPHVLQDQSLRSTILVKAVDRAGNEKIVTVQPGQKLPWYQNVIIWIIMVVITLAILWRFKKYILT